MKQAKSKGALIVSLLLAFVMLGIYAVNAVTLGVMVYKAKTGTSVTEDTVYEEPESSDDWIGTGTALHDNPAYVTLDCVAKDGGVRGIVMGYCADGTAWEYTTPVIETTQIEPIQEIAAFEDVYVLGVGGEIIALDTHTGKELWRNFDFGGQGIACAVDADRTMYLSGYFFPDLCIIDINGNTLNYVDHFMDGYERPYDVMLSDDGRVKITFEQGPADINASILYDPNDGSFYAFEGEFVLASEMQTWQKSFISLQDDDQLRDKYTMYALVHIDNDGVPEMIGKGENRSVVLWHDRAKNETHIIEFTGDNYVDYYPGTGIFSNTVMKDSDVSSEYSTAYYRLTGSGFEQLGEFWNKSTKDANGKYQYEYKLNGQSVDAPAYHDARESIEEECSGVNGDLPDMFTDQEIDNMILNWYDSTDDAVVAREMAKDLLEYRTNADGYRLIDLNGDGLQELFYYEHKSYGDYGYVYVFDPQTHQNYATYTSIDFVGRVPGTDWMFDTTSISSSTEHDWLYKVERYRVVTKQNGSRYMYNNGADTECYLGGKTVSEEEYIEAFSVLLGDVEYLADGSVSYDSIMQQLQ